MLQIKYNGVEHPLVERFNFSAGEVGLKVPILKGITFIEVRADLHSSEDIMELLMVSSALTQAYFGVEKILTIPYFPYSRQDRVCFEGEASGGLMFKTMLTMLTMLTNYKEMWTWDIHNEELITFSRFLNIELSGIILGTKFGDYLSGDFKHRKDIVLIIPDKGAVDRVTKLADTFNLETVQAYKVDRKTMVDSGFKGRDCVIVDDICDDGNTFIELAKKLKGANSIVLYVTHGIFAKTIRPLLASGIEHIYTTNSFPQANSPFITVLEI